MNKLLEYPFDSQLVLKKRKSIKKELLQDNNAFLEKRVALLGGSTTNDIKDMLDLFLLNNGIKAQFYESEFGQYWQDAMFDNPELLEFKPDIFIIHTSNRNISTYPCLEDDKIDIDKKLDIEFNKFSNMWEKLKSVYKCTIIQNNFEYPYYRLLGNMDVSDIHGKTNYITRLNQKLYEYAQCNDSFYINDINYLSANYGLEKWSDPFYWHMYKYALCLPAIPMLSFSLSNIIKSIYGKNKKAFALDLDNTLWGGVIGDDGVDNIEIGNETSLGQVYSEFQKYLSEYKSLGVLLNVISKNDRENAIAGLNHPDSILKEEDFIMIKANWEPKSINLINMANELSLAPESFVFVDDNPAEREIVRQQIKNVAIPELDKVEHYINVIDKSGYFEVTSLSKEDMSRNEMYKKNIARSEAQLVFGDYSEYLKSLEMVATIKPFEEIYLSRIAQLTNKSNQFNLTTKRYTQEDIAKIAQDVNYVTLYGRLEDKYGDNGIVTLVIGEIKDDSLQIGLWLMSCRVLKRDMEFAMMDEVIKRAKALKLKKITGYYFPTNKNGMVSDFYDKQGFTLESEDKNGNKIWSYMISDNYRQKNDIIEIAE
ncbi:MAG: HAD-IIIC family phosphatase [Bacilli bacterium]